MGPVHPLLLAENEILAELFQHRIRQDGENLIGHSGNQQGNLQLFQAAADLIRQFIRPAGDGKIQIVFHQRFKLNAQEPALGQHSPVLFDHVTEIPLEFFIGDHHRLAEQGADLGTADVENITEPCQVLQGQVVSLCRQPVAQPGAVHKQVKARIPASLTDGCQLGSAVKGSQLGGVG